MPGWNKTQWGQKYFEGFNNFTKQSINYRGFLPYATFGTWKKFALAKNRIRKNSYFMYAVTE